MNTREEDLVKKIEELEVVHTILWQEISKLKLSGAGGGGGKCQQDQQRSASSRRVGGLPSGNFTPEQRVNILESLGQSVNIIDPNCRIIYWNRMAEKLYGYSASEALGHDPMELLTETHDYDVGYEIIHRTTLGESWNGVFPVKNKTGERFLVTVTNTPFYDNDTFVGNICITGDSRHFRGSLPAETGYSLDPQQPLRTAIASKISNSVTNKVRSKMTVEHEGTSGDNRYSVHRDVPTSSGVSMPRGDLPPFPFVVSSQGAPCSSVSIYRSTNESTAYMMDCMDREILWEDLVIGEQIGEGASGKVYHGQWYGSDVAIKVFSKQEYSDDVLLSFKKEVSIMKKLRHPNVLLLMGVVTSPEHLSIVTEFLPCGSLFRLLRKNISRLDRGRRVHMALDIARGMNYLHRCKPPIIHRDLKSSNLLVDKNCSVKVGDFGLSRLKHEMYLTSPRNGTPQWMAPEALRDESCDEKSDVYSYGVVLWELVTEKIPWEHHDPVQVIGGVGFMNRHLEIPKDMDPQWAIIIESCWHSDPQCRPTFQELIERFKGLQRLYR